MERREFVHRGAALAGATLIGFDPNRPDAGLASLQSRVADAPPPISESERAQRREKAQRLMKELGYSAMLIEPGANMVYFTGIEWGRSERLFAFILPQSGKAVVISPAFEEGRAADQVGGRFDIRVWQEHENPETLVAGVLKDWGVATGKLALDGSARVFVHNQLALAAPAIRLATAEPITNACRGIKSAHEIAIMKFANEITLDTYRAAFKTLRVGMTQAELAKNVLDGFAKFGFPGGFALVLFGESSAYPHGLPKPRTLEANQVVLIDGGTSVHGYQSDMTRTVV
ncbi:MAG TPA: Xaa-Pro peptidase family protein, partial [Gemmatimonadaceae bacterium]|nr:Xaa-Pro peptidase family protein [Gemmatimonadaceae bacterium]